jgi:hypothetical protein
MHWLYLWTMLTGNKIVKCYSSVLLRILISTKASQPVLLEANVTAFGILSLGHSLTIYHDLYKIFHITSLQFVGFLSDAHRSLCYDVLSLLPPNLDSGDYWAVVVLFRIDQRIHWNSVPRFLLHTALETDFRKHCYF